MAEQYITDQYIAERHNTSRATVWRRVKTDPRFPRPVKFSPGCTRFKLSELEAWEAAKAETA